MTTKKILSVLICLVMVLSLMPMAAFATETPAMTVTLVSDKTVYTNTPKTPEIASVTYGTETLNSDKYTVTYTRDNGDASDLTSAGVIRVTVTHNDNTSAKASADYTIMRKDLEIVVNSCEKTYGDDDPTFTGTAQDLWQGDSVTYTRESGENVGTYAITATASSNYNFKVIPGTLTIKAKDVADPNVVLEYDSAEYTGSPLTPSVTVKDGEAVISDKEYSVTYENNTNVGKGKVIISDNNTNGNYNITSKTVEFDITQASATSPEDGEGGGTANPGGEGGGGQSTAKTPLKITVNNQTITYGENISSDFGEDYTYEGLAVGHTAQITLGLNGSQIVVSDAKIFAGSDDVTSQYAVTYTPGTLTVNKATGGEALTITAGDQSVAYGSAIDKTKYSVTSGSLPTNAVLTVTLTPSISTVGTGSIAVSNAVIKDAKGADITANYAISYESGALTITPKTVSTPTIKLDRTSYGYTGKAVTPTVTAVYDGNTLIPASEYTVSYENNVNLGTGTVKIVDKDGGNYTVSGYTTFSIVNNVGYKVVMGNGGCWYRGSYYGLGFRCDGPYADFLGITIDGQPVDKSYYMSSEGSTNVGLYPQLLSMLGNGTHYITFKYTSGSATGVFYVGSTAINAVMTGDDSNAGLMALVMCLGVLSSVTILSVLRKKKSGAR